MTFITTDTPSYEEITEVILDSNADELIAELSREYEEEDEEYLPTGNRWAGSNMSLESACC